MEKHDGHNDADIEYIKNAAMRDAASICRGKLRRTAPTVRSATSNLFRVRTAIKAGNAYIDGHVSIPQELEWLLDNWYIAEREAKAAIFELKAAKRLPCAVTSPGRLAVSEAAALYLRAVSHCVTEETMSAYLDSFQERICLTEAELHRFPYALRLELTSHLASCCKKLIEELENDGRSEALADEFDHIFTSLRYLSELDMTDLLESVSRVNRTLLKDKSGVYAELDDNTRSDYRYEIAKIARKSRLSEYKVAQRALELSVDAEDGHVGHYIFNAPLGKVRRVRNGAGYVFVILFFTVLFTILFTAYSRSLLALLFLPFPLSEAVKAVIDYVSLRITRTRRLPRLELKQGVPEDGKTICAVSILLSSADAARESALKLEEYMLLNRDSGSNVMYALLADVPEADTEVLPDDDRHVTAAANEIEKLNIKYGGGFYVFCRRRSYCESDKIYRGWERKRGAILDLCRFLRGRGRDIYCAAGDIAALSDTRYILALDSDTHLLAGTAKELVGTAMHPLNRAVVDKESGTVKSGYGIIQPRTSVELTSAGKSDFSRIFAGLGGVDPYSGVAPELYQNLFDEGSFSGKGIIDIEAYLACLEGRFPENAILSHDLLEGAHLRCAVATSIELTDTYPSRVTSFFERQHRWTRGDWQLIPRLRRRTLLEDGSREDNPLRLFDRWKILDNLRRSLVPVFLFASIVAAMISRTHAASTIAVIALFAYAANLLISGASLLLSKRRVRQRYVSAVLYGFGAQLLRTLTALILLPYEAYISASAIVTACYRMLVSHRRLLSWVTASDSEIRNKRSVSFHVRRMWFCPVFAVLISVLSPHPVVIAISIVWFLSPLFAYALSRDRSESVSVSEDDVLFLKICGGDIWRYFTDTITPDDNFLPPDNVQEQPAIGVAHRTSPTNIGLAMLSALAAFDIGAAEKSAVTGMISNILNTVEQLPKWRGHLYNWYDTQTLSVMSPAYISTVDSGNLACCLVALAEGLRELGETSLVLRVEQLLEAMDFSPLFDEKKLLFYIGIDAESGLPGNSYYDLFSSEAMLTSYYSIARGIVPRKHWRRLGRSLTELNGYRGMTSWTGTMFEYLMPMLLLPCYKDSFLYESNKFCIYAQKHSAHGKPWGMSESAFYAFDHMLGYQYKAHGSQTLALKRGMDEDQVIAPYASFLALPFGTGSAIENLKRIRKLGAEGKYGFYEAIDFTPSRQRKNEYEIVKTFMVHHLGMSLLAIDNTLNHGIMQRRFTAQREMSAYSELLQEKLPIGSPVLKRVPRDIPEKPRRAAGTQWRYETESIDALSPHMSFLGNASYNVLVSETGQTASTWNGLALTLTSSLQSERNCGVTLFLKTDSGSISLLPHPVFDPNVKYRADLSGSVCKFRADAGGISAVSSVMLFESEAGELRTVEIASASDCNAELIVYFEPVISRHDSYESHPAFSKLSLETELIGDALVTRRRPRTRGASPALAFRCDRKYEFDTSRELSLGRGGLKSLETALSHDSKSTLGSVLDPCVLVRIPVSLRAGDTAEVRFSLAASLSADGAAEAAGNLLGADPRDRFSALEEAAVRLNMTPKLVSDTMRLLSAIVFPSPSRRISDSGVSALLKGQRGLWGLGISGDLPIVTVVTAPAHDLTAEKQLLSAHRLLSSGGVAFDLVFLLSDAGDYRSPQKTALTDALREMSLEWLVGARGGVHFCGAGNDSTELLIACSAVMLPADENIADTMPQRPEPLQLYRRRDTAPLEYGYDSSNNFVFTIRGELPYNSWSHVLTNGRFGYLATDTGTGHMWYDNARENKITRWMNDSLATTGTESLELITDNGRISLYASPEADSCIVKYGFGFASWTSLIGSEKYTVTAFVPMDTDARVLIIESAAEKPFQVLYKTDLVLGSRDSDSVYVCTKEEGGLISASNPYNTGFSGMTVSVTASAIFDRFTCSKLEAESGVLRGTVGTGFPPCIAAEYTADGSLVIITGCASADDIGALSSLGAAQAALARTTEHWKSALLGLTVSTPSAELNHYLNGWAQYQTLACRVMARTSLYQSGGAYGFRDQLQDVCALTFVAPNETRAQLIRCAEHQFPEGDVQHWWHPGTADGKLGDKGVRTKCSDDLLWLAYALCEYVERTGDVQFCETAATYLTSPALTDEESERYEQPQISDIKESLFSHAVRAIELVITRGTGAHGLCFIGGGDWNDGMNLVGANGQGESVWLTWFLSLTAGRMASLCRRLERDTQAERYDEICSRFRSAAENAWDGSWYLRGYFDNGDPLGSADCDECRIDSIAQSFAVFAEADKKKTESALKSAIDLLYNKQDRVVMLFDPPFSTGNSMPGYIKGYSPGFRENGGQYTHGAVWLCMALLEFGMTDIGWDMLRALLPGGRPNEVYRTEPYVLPADVYSNESHVGRGGWTWYTGASGWFYRVAMENLLGLRFADGVLHISPQLPSDWGGYVAVFKCDSGEYKITVRSDGKTEITKDGAPAVCDRIVTDGQ